MQILTVITYRYFEVPYIWPMLDAKYFYRDILKNFFIDYSKHNWLAVVFALLKENFFNGVTMV